MRIIDLTLTLSEKSLSYPGDTAGLHIEAIDMDHPTVRLSSLNRFDPHCSTHIDAPLHFVPGGADVANLPLAALEAKVIVCRGQKITAAALPADTLLGKAVLFSTGWDSRADTVDYFDGYPALTRDAAKKLVEAGVGLVGLDTPSVDPMDAYPDYPAHHILLQAGIPIVEGLCHLDSLLAESGPILFAAFPLKIHGIEASPVRAVALLLPSPPTQ